jgi:hypothetical protein
MSENKSVFNWTFCQLLMKNPIGQKHDMTDPHPKHLVAFIHNSVTKHDEIL